MANIGQQLTSPETGWRRYDDTDSRIIYIGSWTDVSSSSTNYYGGSIKRSITVGDKIKFRFYGTKLRIICDGDTDKTTCEKITIDDFEDSFSLVRAQGYQYLVYEKIGLPLGLHQVTIEVTEAKSTTLDAIDIDQDGKLIHPYLTEKKSLDEMEIGDIISCRYTAQSGSAGIFSELGACNADEIPVNGTGTPDGLFYFIKVDDNLLIADRVVQTGISWGALNASKFIEGCLWGTKSIAVFNGTNSYIAVPYNTDLAVKKITLRARVYKENWNVSKTETMVSKFHNGGYGFTINGTAGNGAGKIGFAVYVSSSYRLASYPLSSLSSGWHELVGTYDGSTVKLFIDGVKVDSVSISGSIGYSYSNSLMFGCDVGSGSTPDPSPAYFNGKISEVAIWNDALTDEEVQNLYGKEIPLDYRNLVSLWDFSFVTNKVFDKKSSYDGTLYNVTVELVDYNDILIRSLSGGAAYLDNVEGYSISNQNLGAWPSNNEYDKYLNQSYLNRKITPSDENIWHHSNIYSFCKDTPINGISNGSNTTNNGRKISRKGILLGLPEVKGTATTVGFRPVLQLKHSEQTNFWY